MKRILCFTAVAVILVITYLTQQDTSPSPGLARASENQAQIFKAVDDSLLNERSKFPLDLPQLDGGLAPNQTDHAKNLLLAQAHESGDFDTKMIAVVENNSSRTLFERGYIPIFRNGQLPQNLESILNLSADEGALIRVSLLALIPQIQEMEIKNAHVFVRGEDETIVIPKIDSSSITKTLEANLTKGKISTELIASILSALNHSTEYGSEAYPREISYVDTTNGQLLYEQYPMRGFSFADNNTHMMSGGGTFLPNCPFALARYGHLLSKASSLPKSVTHGSHTK
jgi:hypothetical protein